MKHNFNEVRDTQEIRTVPDYVALSKALQKDMLEASQHIRNALYDNPHMETLAIALTALDFSHFIPIENTLEALEQEKNRLSDEWFDTDDLYIGMAIMGKIDDLEAEIARRKVNPCDKHFKGGWYITTEGERRMAVPPHMGVDADKACPKCRGWLGFPSNFAKWDGEA